MIPRQHILDTYWKFAAARQDVFFSRIFAQHPPWSDNPIIASYKFCNSYRASDRVSQYLIKNVIYNGCQREEEVLFRILLFKIFNKIETWQYIENRVGTIKLRNFNIEQYARILDEAQNRQAIYTSAYMSCATKAYGYDKKHQNHLALICQMVQKDNLVKKIIASRSLHEVFNLLVAYPLIGHFMAYQLATDINYSEVVDFDENSFTAAGPGAVRGIKKCFVSTGTKTLEDVIRWMQENQKQEFTRLGLEFKSLWGRPLQLIDCQNLFCETDKYCRAAFPELPSNRKRIKARFKHNSERIDYFYPPKWGINEKIKMISMKNGKVALN